MCLTDTKQACGEAVEDWMTVNEVSELQGYMS